MKRLYIAGAGAEAAKVKALAEWVKRFGGEITVEWWEGILAEKQPHDRDLTDVAAEEFANQDLRGIDEADIFWLVLPDEKVGAGHLIEFGYAIGDRAATPPDEPLWRTIIVSGDWRRSIFTRRADLRFDNHAEALAHIQTLLAAAEETGTA